MRNLANHIFSTPSDVVGPYAGMLIGAGGIASELLTAGNEIVAALEGRARERVAQIRMLAHYTSIEALESIITTKQIWFSNSRDMKDIDEIKRATEIASGTLAERGPKILRSIMFSECGAVTHFERLRKLADSETYIFSLSDHGIEDDRVAMWSSYDRHGRGICIVFRKEALLDQRAAGRFPAKWVPVIYGRQETVAAAVERILEDLERIFMRRPRMQNLLQVVALCIAGTVLTRAFSHKHISFEFEREIRFVHSPALQFGLPLPHDAHVKDFGPPGEPKKKFVLPLRKYPEWSVDAELSNLIDHIIIEPSYEMDRRILEVRSLLETHGLQHVPVRASSSPYRPRARVA